MVSVSFQSDGLNATTIQNGLIFIRKPKNAEMKITKILSTWESLPCVRGCMIYCRCVVSILTTLSYRYSYFTPFPTYTFQMNSQRSIHINELPRGMQLGRGRGGPVNWESDPRVGDVNHYTPVPPRGWEGEITFDWGGVNNGFLKRGPLI